MAIGILTVGPTADGIEVLHGLTWCFQTQTPDGIARARERSCGAVQHQDRLVGGGEMDGDVVGSLEAEARSISAAEQGTTNSASSFTNDHRSRANRSEPYGRFSFAEEIKASALTVPF